MIVVDASVAVKWFLPEPGSAEAASILRDYDTVSGPDLLAIEVSATLVRGANVVKANRAEAETALAKFADMVAEGKVLLHRLSARQIDTAASHAMDLGHPLKDCVYLAMAMDAGCPLMTADARFAAKARAVYADVRLLGGDGDAYDVEITDYH